MIKNFSIPFCVILDSSNDIRVYKAVNHRHAVAITLKLVDDYKKYAQKEIEVYEWLKPFSSRHSVFVDDRLLSVIEHEHGTANAKLQASISRVHID